MKFRSHRPLTLAIPVAIVVAALAGCSTPAAEDEVNEFTLSYPLNTDASDFFKAAAEEYMDAFPDVTITLNPIPNDQYGTTLRTQLQGGSASDVFYTALGSGQDSSVIPLAEAGLLLPIESEASAATVPEQFTSYVTVDGKLYAQPVDQVAAGVIWSGGTAEALGGVEMPATYDDLIDTCEELSAAGSATFAIAGAAAPNTSLLAQVISGSFVYAQDPDWNEQRAAGEVTFADSDGWKSTLEAIVEMYDSGCFEPGAEGAGFDAIDEWFVGGKAPAMFAPGGYAASLEESTPALAPNTVNNFPAVEGEQVTFLSPNNALSVNAKTNAATAVTAFLDWLASDEGAAIFAEASGNLPIVGEVVLDDSYANVATAIEDGDYVALPNVGWPNSRVNDALGSGVQGLLTGQADVDTVLASMDAAWDE